MSIQSCSEEELFAELQRRYRDVILICSLKRDSPETKVFRHGLASRLQHFCKIGHESVQRELENSSKVVSAAPKGIIIPNNGKRF
ncbi:MAG: hypothetical protein IH987_05200 [Planctomycetes bacterium]|nr:hypothetical protein [Planctomycetota bacterium]